MMETYSVTIKIQNTPLWFCLSQEIVEKEA